MKKLLSIVCAGTLLFTSTVFAQDSGNGPSVFVTHEFNGDSKISSAGVAFNFKQKDSGFGGAVLMSLGRADIVTTKLNVEDYLAWELGGRIGYFSDISIYAEAGVDLGELFGRGHLDEDRYHDHDFYDGDDYHDHYHDHDDYYDHDHRFANDSLDAYVGIGGGIKLGQVQVNGQVRYRQIDSEDWKALDDVYSGITVSFSF